MFLGVLWAARRPLQPAEMVWVAVFIGGAIFLRMIGVSASSVRSFKLLAIVVIAPLIFLIAELSGPRHPSPATKPRVLPSAGTMARPEENLATPETPAIAADRIPTAAPRPTTKPRWRSVPSR